MDYKLIAILLGVGLLLGLVVDIHTNQRLRYMHGRQLAAMEELKIAFERYKEDVDRFERLKKEATGQEE